MVGIYEQGDVIEVDFDPTKGHEPAKRRPALVVSSYEFNVSNSMTIVCPITSNERPFPLHESLPDGMETSGVVVMEQIRAIDLDARPSRFVERLDEETLHKVVVCLKSFFD